MMRPLDLVLVGLISAVCVPLSAASHPISGPHTDKSRIVRHDRNFSEIRQWQFTSKNTGESYEVQMYTPSSSPPSNGFPVIYVLDGGALFGSFMEAVRTRSNAGELEHAVVVGIEGAHGPKGADRFYDFSSSGFSEDEKKFVVDADPNAKHGGSELFFQTIEREIKPRVAELVHIDSTQTTLFGWSLGGQFTLHVLFKHPDSFRTFEALSPAIWWNDRWILRDEPGLFEKISSRQIRPRIFIGAGAREQDVPIDLPDRDFNMLKIEMQHARMVDNARDLAVDLQARDTGHLLILASRIFESETHNSVPWAALNTVLDFAIGRPEAFAAAGHLKPGLNGTEAGSESVSASTVGAIGSRLAPAWPTAPANGAAKTPFRRYLSSPEIKGSLTYSIRE